MFESTSSWGSTAPDKVWMQKWMCWKVQLSGARKSQEWTSWHQVAGVDIAGVDIEGVAKQQ